MYLLEQQFLEIVKKNIRLVVCSEIEVRLQLRDSTLKGLYLKIHI